MTGVRRFREPVAWVVLVIVILLALGSIAITVYQAINGGSWLVAAAGISTSVYNPLSAIALTAVVATCVMIQPPSDHARTLSTVAAWFATIAVGLELILGLIGLGASGSALAGGIELVGLITLALVPALSAWLLWRFRAGLPAPVTTDRAGRESSTKDAVGPGADDAGGRPNTDAAESEPDAGDQRGPPALWRPDEASGAVWRRAADAAAGAQAANWGHPGGGAQWTPGNVDPASQQTPERSADSESRGDRPQEPH